MFFYVHSGYIVWMSLFPHMLLFGRAVNVFSLFG